MDSKEIIKKFSDLSALHKVLIYVLLLIISCGSYWYFILDDQLIQIARLTQTEAQLDKDIALFRTRVATLPELEKQLAVVKKELYYAKTLLPENTQALENLLASFEQLGRSGEVEFILFQPGAETKADYYATRNVQLQISGTFHNLMTYFDALSRLDRLVSIKSVVFNPVSDLTPTEKYLNSNLELQVYRALTEAEIKAREAEQAKK